MFVLVYADLVNLAKSEELKKSAFDMNIHYLELNGFLQYIEEDPSIAFNPNTKVFPSECRLYEGTSKLNHRIKPKNIFVYKYLFTQNTDYNELVKEKLSKGAATLRSKLKSYAKGYLTGGKYWDPPEEIKIILKQIKPINNIC